MIILQWSFKTDVNNRIGSLLRVTQIFPMAFSLQSFPWEKTSLLDNILHKCWGFVKGKGVFTPFFRDV